MQVDYKKIIKNSFFLFFRMMLMIAVGFYTVKVVLETLGEIDYGIYNVVASFILILAFLNGALTSGTQRFLAMNLVKNESIIKKTFSIVLTLHIVLAIIIFILAGTIGLSILEEKIKLPVERYEEILIVYQLVVISTMISIIQVPYNSIILAHERMDVLAYLGVAEALLKLSSASVLMLVDEHKLIKYAFIMLLVSIFIGAFNFFYSRRNYKEACVGFNFNIKSYYAIVKFSGWNTIGYLSGVLSTNGVNILLNAFNGPVAVAAIAISMQIGNGIQSISNALQQAFNPQVFKTFSLGKNKDFIDLMFINAKTVFIAVWIVLFPVYWNVNSFLHTWLDKVPANAAIFCELILLQTIIYTLMRPFVMGVHAVGKMKTINLTAGLVLISVIPISYVLLKSGYPIHTPMVIIISANSINLVIEIYLLKLYVGLSLLSFTKKVLMPVVLIVSLSSITAKLFFDSKGGEGILILLEHTVVNSLVVLIGAYLIVLNKIERSILHQNLKKLKNCLIKNQSKI